MSYGLMMGGQDAVRCLEMYQDNFPDEIKTEEFCDEYERVLNRVRYEVDRSIPIPPKKQEIHSNGIPCFYLTSYMLFFFFLGVSCLFYKDFFKNCG